MSTPTQPRRRLAAVAGLVLAAGLLAGPLASTSGAQPSVGVAEGAPPVACPAPEGNARFVRFIYLNILFRCPDAAGSAYWTDRLDSGYSRSAFTLAIDMSSENLVNNNVVPLYGGILQRDPTPAEVTDGVAEIRRLQWDGQLIARLFSSDEFYDGLDAPPGAERDEQWLTIGYNNILDRDPDPAGEAYYLGLMGSPSTAASRNRVASILEKSGENAQGWVFGAFFAGLNRPPDQAGFQYWTQWLRGPGQWRAFKMWTLILSSNEGYNRAQTQPSPEMLRSRVHPEGRVGKADLAG